MSLGDAARRVLGPAFPIAASAYRRLFMDVRKVAGCIPPIEGLLLDVGGGHGAILNPLLDRQPELRVISLDISPAIGQALRHDLLSRVDLRPATSVRDYVAQGGLAPHAAFLSDVIHHVAREDRKQLIRDVLATFGDTSPVVIVKDVLPRGIRSKLGFYADRYISNDKGVTPIGPEEMVQLMRSVHADLSVESTPLLSIDYPNYCLIFRGQPGQRRMKPASAG